MGEIHVHEFMSLDGVIDEPTWTFDYGFHPKIGEAIGAVTKRSRAILLGRKTYEMFEPASVRRLSLVTLVVRDYDEAIEFFVGRVGFELVEDSQLEDGTRWVVVSPGSSGATAILLARAVTAEQEARIGNQTGGRVSFFLETEDFDAEHRRLSENGVVFVEQPRTEAYGTVAIFEDLCGNRWDLIEPAR